MKTKKYLFISMILASVGIHQNANSCTGITLKSSDGATIVARSVEWAEGESPSDYMIVPRGYEQQSALPDGTNDGMRYMAFYGYVGLASENYVIEGLNEAGLSAGLFYFPKFGSYPVYNSEEKDITLSDTEFVAWVLGNFSSIDDVIEALSVIRVVSTDTRAQTLHWRVADKSGRQIVIEYINGIPMVHENKLGVLTNAPSFDWQITNLNNYINLHSGGVEQHDFGNISLFPLGSGTGLLGLPGDNTPPSRFIKAAFYQNSAPIMENAEKAVNQAFVILESLTIPIGSQYAQKDKIPPIPSATQWTSVSDLKNNRLYYTTMYNPIIRVFDLDKIDFTNVAYQIHSLDNNKLRPMIPAQID